MYKIVCRNVWVTLCLLHRKLIQKVCNSHDSARNAKQQMQLYKSQIVQSMSDEYKDMMQQALDEVLDDLKSFFALQDLLCVNLLCCV